MGDCALVGGGVQWLQMTGAEVWRPLYGTQTKNNSPRCDAAKRGVPSRAILFAERNSIEKLNKI